MATIKAIIRIAVYFTEITFFFQVRLPWVVMGRVKTEEKSNEITTIPELLKVLDISGSIVTIDAMGCQKKIVDQIIAQDL